MTNPIRLGDASARSFFTAEDLASLDMRWPYPPARPRWCARCCRLQDRRDWARIRAGERDWEARQARPNLATDGTTLCSSCAASERDERGRNRTEFEMGGLVRR